MEFVKGSITLVLGLLLVNVGYGQYHKPEQIHLSYGVDPTRMVVTWSTMNQTYNATCNYGVSSLDKEAVGSTKFFPIGLTQYIHRVTLSGLSAGSHYSYRCGNGKEWSDTYQFTAMRTNADYSPTMAFYGDLGTANAQSLNRLHQDVIKGLYDVILHVGDFAYNLEDNSGKVGDDFMRNIQPLASTLPYMTCPGNHEVAHNFSSYKSRFTMPGDEGSTNMFYSFNIGPAHIVSFCTEYYYFLQYGWTQLYKQYEWLQNDLQEANKPENRAKQPWIITMGHKPMYCSNNNTNSCTNYQTPVRIGLPGPGVKFFGLEKMFYENGVDLSLWAHEHSYERLWPIYDKQVYNGSLEEPYTNPKAPVHIITGSAGCASGHDPFKNKTAIQPWSAFRTEDYGYSRMRIFNRSHLYIEQVSDDKGGKVVDNLWLIKDKHGSY